MIVEAKRHIYEGDFDYSFNNVDNDHLNKLKYLRYSSEYYNITKKNKS